MIKLKLNNKQSFIYANCIYNDIREAFLINIREHC